MYNLLGLKNYYGLKIQIQNFVLVFLDDSWHGRVGRMRCQIYESHYQKSGNASRCRESPKKNQNKVLYLNFEDYRLALVQKIQHF